MILELYTIKDKLMNFTGPVAMRNDEVAKRWFESECRKKKALDYTSTKYYDLYKIGQFDSEKGTVIGMQQSEIQLIMEGEIFDEQRA